MIPLSDDNTARIRTPFVNIGLIILNIIVFVYYQGFGTDQLFTASFATIPNEILTGNDVVYEGNIGVTPYSVYLTIFSAMFMHGGFAHLGGNLLYLWVFGDNLENRMGHFKYLLFYLLTGVIATFCHVGLCFILQKDLNTPSLGASGAISGVLGGYLLLFPKNQVKVLLIAFIIRVPAFITLGLWIGLQLWSGWGSLGKAEGAGGVAYAAHIGGFVAGMLLARYFVSSSDSIGRTRKKSYLR
jgi:membrane associated rhomboid family serine protease